LLLGQRTEVIVLGAGQVSPCAQRCSLAVHDKGLAAKTKGLLHLLDLRDIQWVIGAVAWDDKRGHRHAQRIQRGNGDLDLGLIVAIFTMTELEQAQFGECFDVGVGGRGIDAKEVRIEVVNTNGVLIEFRLAVLPRIVPSEVVEHVGKAVVLEVEGANGFAQTGLEEVEVGLCPKL